MRIWLYLILAGLAAGLPATAWAQNGARPAAYDTDAPVADIRAGAEAGDANAQFALAELYNSGIQDVPCDSRIALMWLEKAAAQGHEYAVERLPQWKNDLATYERERAAALSGDAQAQYEFGRDLYKLGCFGEDRHNARTWVMRAVRQGHGEAMAWFGDYYAYGYEYYRNFPKTKANGYPEYAANLGAGSLPAAISWYKRAARAGSASAYNMLPILYGMDSPVQDIKVMETWLIRDVYRPLRPGEDPSNWPRAFDMHELCWYYDMGTFNRSSRMGHPLSTHVEVAPRPAEAFGCHRSLHAMAEGKTDWAVSRETYRLAQLYELGRGAPRDPVIAEALYRQLVTADADVRYPLLTPLAVMRLGLLVQARGDLAEAYRWLARTRDEKHCPRDQFVDDYDALCRRAAAARDAIAVQLPAEEKARLDKAARKYVDEAG